jgi:hypothetical protein
MSYDDEAWLRMAERLFEYITVPQAGYGKLYACRAFLESAPEEFYQRHPREWQAIALAALQDGTTYNYEQLAQDARVSTQEIKRRLGRQ